MVQGKCRNTGSSADTHESNRSAPQSTDLLLSPGRYSIASGHHRDQFMIQWVSTENSGYQPVHRKPRVLVCASRLGGI